MYVLLLANTRVTPGCVVTVPPCLNVLPLWRVNVLETISVNVPASRVPRFVTVTFAAAAAADRVIVKPPWMVASSPATGNDAPPTPPEVADQFALLFQLPVATENLVTAHALVLASMSRNAAISPATPNPRRGPYARARRSMGMSPLGRIWNPAERVRRGGQAGSGKEA